jgi:hypothetical protein
MRRPPSDPVVSHDGPMITHTYSQRAITDWIFST